MLVQIKAYVGKANEDLEKGSMNGPEVGKYIIDKLQKLKYSIGMLA